MIIAVEDERKSWMLLDDRIGFFLNGIDKIMIGSVNYRLLIICITSLIEYMISSFPFGPIHKDAVDVADALPQIVDRDRLLGVFLKWRDHSLCEESGNAIDRSIDNWVNSASQPRCSASFLSSIIVSWTSSVSRPLLYKRGVFLAAHTDALLLAHHFKLSEKLLVSVYNPEHMQYIRNQFECK